MNQKPSILFAIPCYGGLLYDTCVSGIYQVAKKLDQENIASDLLLVANESLISTGRSNIANMFVNDTKYDYLMCIDSDVGFHWSDIYELLNARKEFVTGAYSMKIIPPKYNFQVTAPVKWEGDLLEIDHIGTGFQLVHRSVFTQLANKFPELKYTPSPHAREISPAMKSNSYHFYDTMIDGDIVPEDISFCRRWRKTGGKIWLNTNIELTHNGSHVFTGIPNLKDELKKALH